METVGEDYRIVSDSEKDGVRHITAVPSAMVCSKQIDFDLKDGNLHNVKYLRGCDGNLQAVGRLLEGMSAEKAVEILDGVNCHGRGTSCTDQNHQTSAEIAARLQRNTPLLHLYKVC